jgi:hypothetical protein
MVKGLDGVDLTSTCICEVPEIFASFWDCCFEYGFISQIIDVGVSAQDDILNSKRRCLELVVSHLFSK